MAGSRQPLAECSSCLLEFLCALFSFSHLSPRDVQPSPCAAPDGVWPLLEIVFIPGKKSGRGEGERSCDGVLVQCDRCAAAPVPLRRVLEASGNCGAAGAIPALSHSYLEGENRAQWG